MRIIVLISSLIFCSFTAISQSEPSSSLNKLSEDLLQNIKDGKPTAMIEKSLFESTLIEDSKQLDSNDKQTAFWVNIYNAYIQIVLTKDPSLFDDRGKFYGLNQVPIFGLQLSFDDIEHGIIRRSEYKYFLGYLKRLFVPEWEKTLRVEKKDGRVHFALNCGAIDCPPVRIYTPSLLDRQLDQSAMEYLHGQSSYDKVQNSVKTTPLFKWFRGDFEGSKGIREMLRKYKIYPLNDDFKVTVTGYDWSLSLGDFKEW